MIDNKSLFYPKKSMPIFIFTIQTEILLIYRRYSEALNPLLFFAMVLLLFPLGVSPNLQLLASLAPGIIWIAVLLSVLLTLERLFQSDFDDGILEQLLLSSHSLPLILLAKLLAHWLMNVLPLIFLTLFSVPLLHLPLAALPALIGSLLLGTPTLLLMGAIGRALTLGLRNSGLLVILLVLPFFIPVLIFGTSSVTLAAQGLPVAGQLACLGVLLFIALPLAPIAAASALRIAAST
jgi:heme exporter protein B